MIFILISSTGKILWLPNYKYTDISIKRLLKLNWRKNYANQIHLTVHFGLGKTRFGRSILHGRSNCWEKKIRNIFFQGVKFWTGYVEVACTWEIMEMNLWEMNNGNGRLGKCEGWKLVGMKGGHAHKNSCMLEMNEEICWRLSGGVIGEWVSENTCMGCFVKGGYAIAKILCTWGVGRK